MDSLLKAKVQSMSRALAREEQAKLRGAMTMLELEELACEIGDEFTIELMSLAMAERSNEAAEAATCACPDCGQFCGQGKPKPRTLAGVRGEVRYHEPSFFCPACRRSFFPGGGPSGPLGARDGDAEVAAKNDLGGSQPEQL